MSAESAVRPLLVLAALCLGGCTNASFLAANVPATFEHYQRTRDQTVRLHTTRNLAAAIARAGGRVSVRYYDGLGHADLVGTPSIPLRQRAPVLDEIAAFVAPPAPGGNR